MGPYSLKSKDALLGSDTVTAAVVGPCSGPPRAPAHAAEGASAPRINAAHNVLG